MTRSTETKLCWCPRMHGPPPSKSAWPWRGTQWTWSACRRSGTITQLRSTTINTAEINSAHRNKAECNSAHPCTDKRRSTPLDYTNNPQRSVTPLTETTTSTPASLWSKEPVPPVLLLLPWLPSTRRGGGGTAGGAGKRGGGRSKAAFATTSSHSCHEIRLCMQATTSGTNSRLCMQAGLTHHAQ